MKLMIRIIPTLTALVLAATPLLAVESPSEKVNVSKLELAGPAPGSSDRTGTPFAGEDRQLAMQKADFMKFAATKVKEMNSNNLLSRSRMQIDKGRDGLYRACFHEIDAASLSCQVRRSQSSAAPYVAVLSYQEQVFAASCATPEACRQGQFVPVEAIPNRHIFVYSNGSWN
ncbi:MAG: hypothetical protein FIB02_10055 [Desulfuromonas sp.]|nr:hypothetical protein [Desulfuromonas sp.]